MNQKVGGPFDLTAFFWHVVKFLDDEDFKEEVGELVNWWNHDHTTGGSTMLPQSIQLR
jgi:hypothetical protein